MTNHVAKRGGVPDAIAQGWRIFPLLTARHYYKLCFRHNLVGQKVETSLRNQISSLVFRFFFMTGGGKVS